MLLSIVGLVSLLLVLLDTRVSRADVNDESTWYLEDNIVGTRFLSAFNWNTFDDPTHGRVNYISKEQAVSSNLSYAHGDKFVMRPDSANVVEGKNVRGRDSIRISSKKPYGDVLIVLDLEHMPTGCGTWPAFWTCTDGNWPQGGEVDIIEGVHRQTNNLATLHTSENCSMPHKRAMTGHSVSDNCDVHASDNQGCGVEFAEGTSYGAGFNGVDGGYYVMQRTVSDGVSVWFWERNDPRVPPEITTDSVFLIPDEDEWGTPNARFVTDQCDMAKHFDNHVIIFDLTFCGDWAGSKSVWQGSGCAALTGKSCNDFVDQTPEAFRDAYWEVNALRIYTL